MTDAERVALASEILNCIEVNIPFLDLEPVSDSEIDYGETADRIIAIIEREKAKAVALEARERVIAVTMMREAAAHACEEQARLFLSPEYATGQPLSSFSERFACKECADAIRSLPLTTEAVHDR